MPRSNRAESTEVMTIPELAEFLKCHPSTIYRMLRRKQVPSFRVGSDHRFLRKEIQRWSEDGGARP